MNAAVDNKFPGKDVSLDDLENRLPLVAKKSPDHKTTFTCAGVEMDLGTPN